MIADVNILYILYIIFSIIPGDKAEGFRIWIFRAKRVYIFIFKTTTPRTFQHSPPSSTIPQHDQIPDLDHGRRKYQVALQLRRATAESHRVFMGQQHRHLPAEPPRSHCVLREVSPAGRPAVAVQSKRDAGGYHIWGSEVGIGRDSGLDGADPE